jgi:aminoglycoside 3-N-acetyltransferase
MPTSSNKSWQLEFIQSDPVFDVRNTPSAMGAITEVFRKTEGVLRSIHPTESVACKGPRAKEFVEGHFGAERPYLANSPFGKVIEEEGLILMIGVTLDNAGTNVHCLEDAVDFPFPIYVDQLFPARVIDYQGIEHVVQTKVHNPVFSKKRYCDYFIPILEKNGSLIQFKLGDAPCLLIKAKEMFETLKFQLEQGRTIYGPTK